MKCGAATAPGAEPRDATRHGVGHGHDHRQPRGRGLCGLPAAKARSRRRAAPDRHGARRRLRTAGDPRMTAPLTPARRILLPIRLRLAIWYSLLLAVVLT